MLNWYEWLCLFSVPAITFFIFQFIWNRVMLKRESVKSTDDTLKLGVQALLRNELMQGYKCFIKQGWIDISDKQNYDNMYQCYHNLGKNGVMDSMYEKIMQLPTTPKNN